MFDSLIHQNLLKLDPEVAHHYAISGLKAYQKLPDFLFKPRDSFFIHPLLPQLKFRGRVGLAAGFDKNAEVFIGLARLGFGFIEVGTVTPLPQLGNPKPRIWRVPGEGLVNALGFNNVGLETFKDNLSKNYSRCPVPVFANIGKGKETPNDAAHLDYQKSAEALEPFVDGFVINISSPNTAGLRELQTVGFCQAIIGCLSTARPIFLKLAPDLSDRDLEGLLHFIVTENKIKGVVLTNTSIQIARNREYPNGGYSGPELFARSLEAVKKAKGILGDRKVIIAVGGINSLHRVNEMLNAGADLLEIYTAFIYRGAALPSQLNAVSS